MRIRRRLHDFEPLHFFKLLSAASLEQDSEDDGNRDAKDSQAAHHAADDPANGSTTPTRSGYTGLRDSGLDDRVGIDGLVRKAAEGSFRQISRCVVSYGNLRECEMGEQAAK